MQIDEVIDLLNGLCPDGKLTKHKFKTRFKNALRKLQGTQHGGPMRMHYVEERRFASP